MNDNPKKIWLSPPHLGEEEYKFVTEAFASNWIAPLGPNVDGFEEDICKYLQISHAAALSSGTAAIHLALKIIGVQQGDFVICPSFTFSATANPIIYENAIPVFIDSEEITWNMDANILEEGIRYCIEQKKKKPAAIIAVHLYGMPADMDAIVTVASKYNIPVIEDAAEALGSKYKGKAAGTIGVLNILSFNGNKIITTSGGGALVSNNEDYINTAKFLATQARDKAPHYEHSQIGYNYRLSNICAAIGRGQMTVLNNRIKQRRWNFEQYQAQFSDIEAIKLLREPEYCYSNRWLSTIILDEKKSAEATPEYLRTELEKDNIEARPLWKPLHLQPVFQKYPAFINGTAENLFRHGLCLPSGSALTEDDLERIAGIVKRSLLQPGI